MGSLSFWFVIGVLYAKNKMKQKKIGRDKKDTDIRIYIKSIALLHIVKHIFEYGMWRGVSIYMNNRGILFVFFLV